MRQRANKKLKKPETITGARLRRLAIFMRMFTASTGRWQLCTFVTGVVSRVWSLICKKILWIWIVENHAFPFDRKCPFHISSAWILRFKMAIHPYPNSWRLTSPTRCLDLADGQSQSSRPPMPPRIPRPGILVVGDVNLWLHVADPLQTLSWFLVSPSKRDNNLPKMLGKKTCFVNFV